MTRVGIAALVLIAFSSSAFAAGEDMETKEITQPENGGRRTAQADGPEADSSVDGRGDRVVSGGPDDRAQETPADELFRQLEEGQISITLASRLAELKRTLANPNIAFKVVGVVATGSLLYRLGQFMSQGGMARLMVRGNPALALLPPQYFDLFFSNPNTIVLPRNEQYSSKDIIRILSLPPDEQKIDPILQNADFRRYLIQVLISVERQVTAWEINEA